MEYQFSFYQEKDYEEIVGLVLASYQWDYPAWGLSNLEFSKGLHPRFLDVYGIWERTVGIFRKNGKIAACAINDCTDRGDVFFLFDSKERSRETALLSEMIYYAKTTMSSIEEDWITRYVDLHIPEWNQTLRALAEKAGFVMTDNEDRINVLPFPDEAFQVSLPEGYSFADGETTPDFFLANVHTASFNYRMGGRKDVAGNGVLAFHDMRAMKRYNKKLDLCILDPMKRPVALAVIWYDEKMPYCELEPLGVAWWERRKHLATAILHEASNRVMRMYPNCRGMLGGDQTFYEKNGFITKAVHPVMQWKAEIYPSWDEKSLERDYSKDVSME